MQIKKDHIGKVIQKNYVRDLADDFMQWAFDLIEETKLINDKKIIRRKIVSSCILSFLSLEASINRLFFVTLEISIPQQGEAEKNLQKIQSLKKKWEKLSIKEKFIKLPPLISDFQFNQSVKPFILFLEFISFRNQLVHAKSWESQHSIFVTHVNLNEKNHGSWGGKILSTKSLKKKLQEYKYTGFSKTLDDLQLKDAEKSLEIACWMRQELSNSSKISQPVFNFDPPRHGVNSISGPEVMKRFITRHFA